MYTYKYIYICNICSLHAQQMPAVPGGARVMAANASLGMEAEGKRAEETKPGSSSLEKYGYNDILLMLTYQYQYQHQCVCIYILYIFFTKYIQRHIQTYVLFNYDITYTLRHGSPIPTNLCLLMDRDGKKPDIFKPETKVENDSIE